MDIGCTSGGQRERAQAGDNGGHQSSSGGHREHKRGMSRDQLRLHEVPRNQIRLDKGNPALREIQGKKEKERERERERGREREREKERERKRERKKDRQTDRQTDRPDHRQTDR